MSYSDEEVLAALKESIEHDEQVAENIRGAIASHDDEYVRWCVIQALQVLKRTPQNIEVLVTQAKAFVRAKDTKNQ